MIPAKVEQTVPMKDISTSTNGWGNELKPDNRLLMSADNPDFYKKYKANNSMRFLVAETIVI